jgi:MYXO-CTERM domain-containing protein
VVTISPTGISSMSMPQEGLFGIADGSHPGLVEGTYGQDNRPVAFMFQGSITDGGTATLKIYGAAADGQSLEPVRALTWATTTSGGYTSQWYGENPNTPQGRSYPPHGLVLANPGYGVASGYQPTVKSFLVVAHGHHLDHSGPVGQGGCVADPTKGTNDGTCGGKNATSIVVIPVNADSAADPTNPGDPTTGSGSSAAPADPSQALGGCSTTGSQGAGSLILLGVALASTIRRRRAA